MIDKNANGCIMADGMGLGKTVCDPVIPCVSRDLQMIVAMHCFDVDTFETIPRGWKNDYSEVYHCVSFKFSRELGQ